MKTFKYIFLLILMLCAQRVFAYSFCADLAPNCQHSLDMYKRWAASDPSYTPFGDCAFSEVGTGIGRFSIGYGTTDTSFNCDIPVCASGYVFSKSTLSCVLVPTCTAPQVLDTATNTCVNSSSSTSNPPQGACEGSACCKSGESYDPLARACYPSGTPIDNTYNPQAIDCAPEWDGCVAAMTNQQGFTCFRSGGGTSTRTSAGLLTAGTDMGASICLYSSFTNSSSCKVCGKNTTYSVDKDGVLQNTMGDGSSTSSGSTPTLSQRETDCKAQGGTWTHTPASTTSSTCPTCPPDSQAYLDGITPETWTCKTSTKTESYNSNGAVYQPKSTTQQQNLNCGGTTGISCESTQLSVDNSLKTLVVDIKGFSDKFKAIFSDINASDKAQTSVDIITLPEWELIKALSAKMKGNTKSMCKIKITGGWRPKVEVQGHVIDMKFEDLDTLFCDMAYVLRSIFFTLSLFSILHFILQR